MSNDPRLGRRVAFERLGTVGTASRSMNPEGVAEDRGAERLVEGDPMLYSVAESVEGHSSEVKEVASSLLLIQPSSIAIL